MIEWAKENHEAKHLSQRSNRSKVIVQTDTQRRLIALTEPLKRMAVKSAERKGGNGLYYHRLLSILNPDTRHTTRK